ncbi:MAG: transcriptional regulator [Verrucomicrobia bacterium]|nr:transcriptional regulator [Verrucomicrobiota bacterium]
MDEIIVRVARTVACPTRLRILSALAREGECPPSRLAGELGQGRDSISVHLKHLVTAGLIQRRRSGLWCYGVAASPYTEQAFSGRVAAWLYGLLRDPSVALRACGQALTRKSSQADADRALHALLFNAFTAFANVRRLQLLRHLRQHGPATAEALSEALSMSPPALCRHTTKLCRRGYLQTDAVGRTITYRLAGEAQSPAHATLLKLVAAEWTKR